MTLQQLKYFRSTAILKSFSKAAESNFVAQTAISKQIANLESELGVILFIRDKQHVSLTKSGEILLEYSEEILRLCDEAVRDTKMAQLMSANQLRIGYWGILEKRMIVNMMKKYKNIQKNQSFSPLYSSVHLDQVVSSLLNGKQDAILMPRVIVSNISKISYMPLVEPEICLAVGKNHPFASRKEVTVDEVKTESFITVDTSGSAPLQEFRESQWVELGFSPNVVFRAAETESALLMTETGGGVMLVTELMRQYDSQHLSYVSIKGFHMRQEMGMAWLTGNMKPELIDFLDFVNSQEVSIM